MYLYSSDSNSIKIILSKSDAKHLIFNQHSLNMQKNMVSAIFWAALPKTKFSLNERTISVKISEFSKEKYILEFYSKKQRNSAAVRPLFCYKFHNFKSAARLLKTLINLKANILKLYYRENTYFVLSDKPVYGEIYTASEQIKGILEEYCHLISKNVSKDMGNIL